MRLFLSKNSHSIDLTARTEFQGLACANLAHGTLLNPLLDYVKGNKASVEASFQLTKAMVVIPNGTLNRWDVINVWMNDHGAEKERESKAILKKAKELEKTAAKGPLDSAAAFAKFQEDQNKKKSDVNSAEQAQASVNYIKVNSPLKSILQIFMVSKLNSSFRKLRRKHGHKTNKRD